VFKPNWVFCCRCVTEMHLFCHSSMSTWNRKTENNSYLLKIYFNSESINEVNWLRKRFKYHLNLTH
jgi:hypothetical protein